MKQTAVVATAVLAALLLWAGLRFVPNQLMMRTSMHPVEQGKDDGI